MVGVESDEDVVLGGQPVSRLGKHDRSDHVVGDVESRGKSTASQGDLDNAIAALIGKGLQRRVDGDQRRDIDGREGVVTRLGRIDHRSVL